MVSVPYGNITVTLPKSLVVSEIVLDKRLGEEAPQFRLHSRRQLLVTLSRRAMSSIVNRPGAASTDMA